MPKITKSIVDKLLPAEKDLFVWDEEIPCFGVRIKPSGVKSYIYQYRQGKISKRITIGRSPFVSPAEARIKAISMVADVIKGGDPASEKQKSFSAIDMVEMCDRYLEEHARQHKKPLSIKTDISLIENHIIPLLGRKKVKDLTRADLQYFLQAVKSGKTAKDEYVATRNRKIVRGGPIVANRCLALLSKILSLAEDWGVRPIQSNPAFRIQKYKERQIQRYLSEDELLRLTTILQQEEQKASKESSEFVESIHVIFAIWLLLLTGCRKLEILSLKWTSVDIKKREIKLDDSKTGARSVFLSQMAIDVFERMLPYRESVWVIPSSLSGRHLIDLAKPWHRICQRAQITDLRIHDLRHSFASLAVNQGLSLEMIGGLLGHKSIATTRRYSHPGYRFHV